MKKILTIAMLALAAAAYAQKPILSPLPQKTTWGSELSESAVSAITGNITEGVLGDAAVAAYSSKIPQKKDGYYLNLSSTGVVLAGYDERGLFYARKTLQQLLGTDRTNSGHDTKVYAAEIEDWPVVADRGVVEGFYGNPWTHDARLRMFDFLADNKMNMYIYGPKDDPYHWGQWATLYPAAELNKLKELVQYAAQVKVKFVWAVHTGQSLTSAQYDQLYAKFEQLYNIGVRTFGMFYDDAYGNGSTQATILNTMTERFINTHEGCEPFICCPAVYCGTFYGMGDSNYLPDMCSMTRANDIKIMWTGSGVMDMQLGNSVQNFINSYGTKPFIWHNWPVNDYSRDHLFMGKSDGMDNRLYEKITGFVANPMEFPEASKVTVYSIADYLWNMSAYNADRSWQQSWQYLYPSHGTEFGLFCQNSVTTGSGRLVRSGESQYFTQALNSGTSKHTLFTQLYDAATALIADDSDPAVSAEMNPWLRAMQILGQRGMIVNELQQALDDSNPDRFIEVYQQNLQLIKDAAALETHTWYGGSGYICPTFATSVLQPMVNSDIQEKVSAFKRAGYTAPEGMFEPQVIEDGIYFIKHNGRYLTNNGDNPDLTGDRPVFSTTVDDIKPAKQQWRIQLDGTTGRFKITSVADGRYVNENGKFWADKTLNAYDATWNSYQIYRCNGKHAIRNGGQSGTNFWTVNGVNIEKGNQTAFYTDCFIFEIVPVEGEVEYPVIESGKSYYIAYGDKLLTDMSNTGYPIFRDQFTQSWQLFKITSESSKDNRFKITSAKSGSSHSYINELGAFGTNTYYADWNSYYLLERDGLWAIRNAESAGTNFWTVTNDGGNLRITKGGSEPQYIFEIGTDWSAFKDRVTPVVGVKADEDSNSTVYNLSGQRVSKPTRGLYIKGGKKVKLE